MFGRRTSPALWLVAVMLLSSLSALTPSLLGDASGGDDAEDFSFSGLIEEYLNAPNPQQDLELTPAQEQAIALSPLARGANSTWANAGGSEDNDAIYEMAFDSTGNIIICGSVFVDSLFGSIQVFTEGLGDILVAKLSPTGTWLWAVTAGTASAWDECRGLAIDKNDDVYASGYILGNVAFGNTTLYPSVWDGYVARVNTTSGQWDWAMNYGGFDIDVGWDLLVDDDLNIYVSGYFRNSTDFGGHQLVTTNPGDNNRFFIAKYNATWQDWDWAHTSAGQGFSSAFQMDFDQNGDIYVVGYNTGTETWNGTFVSSAAGTWAGFLVKYDTDGNLIWGESFSGNSCGIAQCGVYWNNLVIDSQNRVIVGGNLLGDASKDGQVWYGKGSWDLFVVRYQSTGTFDWGASAGGPNDDRVQSIGVTPNDEVVLGGRMRDWAKFGSSINVSSITSQHNDAVIAQVDASGYWQWAHTFGGNANDSTEAILTYADGSYLAGGYFSGSYIFGSQQHFATDEDIFVWKFQWDSDDDGVHDFTDNCDFVQNQNQSNWDNDSFGDACETDDDNDNLHDVLDDCQFGVIDWDSMDNNSDWDHDGCKDDSEDTDDDNDGVPDLVDLCAKGKLDWESTNITDIDGDGCHDLDEDPDDDNDGVMDDSDNCPLTANAGQENHDGDIFGDICDLDDDNDGVNDGNDDCPMNETGWFSGTNSDNDGDGCQDAGEDTDDDNDGMLDEDDDCPSGFTGWTVSAETDHDWDGCKNSGEDNDDDNDGLVNMVDQCPQGLTNWSRDQTIDADGDGCHDEVEDFDDDNDGFPDVEDDCPNIAGGSYLGGEKGCSDGDGDGWGDTSDLFPSDGTQWDDGDQDGYGDNPYGNDHDSCPLVAGNSSEDRLGCTDTDSDGWSDPDEHWTTSDGADALPLVFDQHADSDGDGYGDEALTSSGNLANMTDWCPNVAGTSSEDRGGCPDFDNDGWSDPDATNLSHPDGTADAFPFEPTQWRDTDGDGYGDNWANSTWDGLRSEDGLGQYLANAVKPDLCPTQVNHYADSDGCPGNVEIVIPEPGSGNGSEGKGAGGEDGGISTSTWIMIGVSVMLVLGLASAILILLKPKTKVPSGRKSGTGGKIAGQASNFAGEQPADPAAKKYEDYLEEEFSDAESAEPPAEAEDQAEGVDSESEALSVSTWEELPSGGEYLDPDESGTIWYRDPEGIHWYQNADESWTQFLNQ